MFKKLFGKTDAPAPPTDEKWWVGTMSVDGFDVIVRSRAVMPAQSVRDRYSYLAEIIWPYEPDPNTGMPRSNDLDDMIAFEDAVDFRLEESGHGLQAVAFTGAGEKRWRYFTPDPGAFAAELSAALSGHKVYPIEMTAVADPEWEALGSVIASKTAN